MLYDGLDGIKSRDAYEKMLREIRGRNNYGEKFKSYQPLPESYLDRALKSFKNLLDEIKEEERTLDHDVSIPSRLVQFRYDGGSRELEEVMQPKGAQTTALVFKFKEREGMKLQVQSLPYYSSERASPGLRVSSYAKVKQEVLHQD
jgi:hypothetical protein